MTKKELKEKISNFLNECDDKENNEWYCTKKELSEMILNEFMEDQFNMHKKIKLDK